MSDCAPSCIVPAAKWWAPMYLALALVLHQMPAMADRIYSGITVEELAGFAKSQGWNVSVESRDPPLVVLRLEDRINRPIRIELSDCDEHRRCMTGIIQDMTYYMLKPNPYGFWHWNLERRGATGFGPAYITLQRYLHFNGVTDRYLRDVIGEIWPRAASSFWDEVEQRYKAEWQSKEPEEKK